MNFFLQQSQRALRAFDLRLSTTKGKNIRLSMQPMALIGVICATDSRQTPKSVAQHVALLVIDSRSCDLISGGPEQRRNFIDAALSRAVPGYARLMSEYRKTLTQRNALLSQIAKGNTTAKHDLTIWTDTLERISLQIRTWRRKALAHSRLHYRVKLNKSCQKKCCVASLPRKHS